MPTAPLDFALPDSGITERLGAALARAFSAFSTGAVVHLRGELGSGKTTCARSLLHALGVTATVRSPTYTLVDTYSTLALNLVHVDLYRLRSSAEVEELGLRDLTGPNSLMLIEWPEQGGGAVPPADLDLQLRYAGESRVASLRAGSDVGAGWLAKLGLDTSLVPYVSNLT
ncbi:MAG: tRNA (adenosine(37)-N6)-threonylcarbamoyltransferase complex ATPase subunit type 1 TsaE [Pseudomonadota bacterium]|nr:tRNA (adenosine(37)-N6)-threonylcarbamoyltransferase complex ATPase subunit type 1 TsaE [Pseudomonadota bacterium]